MAIEMHFFGILSPQVDHAVAAVLGGVLAPDCAEDGAVSERGRGVVSESQQGSRRRSRRRLGAGLCRGRRCEQKRKRRCGRGRKRRWEGGRGADLAMLSLPADRAARTVGARRIRDGLSPDQMPPCPYSTRKPRSSKVISPLSSKRSARRQSSGESISTHSSGPMTSGNIFSPVIESLSRMVFDQAAST